MDKHAVIWTVVAGKPVKMGDLLITERQTRFSYTQEFLDSGNPNGLSLLSSPKVYGKETVVFEHRETFPTHPRLMQFIPGRGRGNIQRRIYTRILEKRATPPKLGFDTDWEILLLAGRNGIGHLDIFRDDLEASDWYSRERRYVISKASRHAFWEAIREDIALNLHEMNPDMIAQHLGTTPTAGGMIPKLLVSIPDNEHWDGRFASAGVGEIKGRKYIDVILKIEPVEYAGVVALERLCLDVHAENGFVVPRRWVKVMDGVRLLAIERFDRSSDGKTIPMESLFSVFATGSREFNGNEDTDMEEVGQRLEKLASVVNFDHKKGREEIYRRYCMAFCTGNGDMHLENISFLGGPGKVEITPVYDPAPMRAWPQHDVRSAIPIIFEPDDSLRDTLLRIGSAFGLTRRAAIEVLDSTLEVTASYTERVMALDNVPIERRKRLVEIVRKERGLSKDAKAAY